MSSHCVCDSDIYKYETSLPPSPLLCLWEGDAPLVIPPPILAHQVFAGLGTSFSTEATQGSPVDKWIPQSSYSFGDSPCSSCETHIEQSCPFATYMPMCQGLGAACVCSLVGGSISERSQRSRLVDFDFVGFPVKFPSPSWPLILPPTLQKKKKSLQLPPNAWLWVSASGLVCCWEDPLRGQSC